jgi:ERCC4-related helicase
MAHLDLDRWRRDLERDRIQLEWLSKEAHKVTVKRDAKLAELKALIAHKVRHPTTNMYDQPNRKVLVFAAFADTASYLYDALHDWVQQELGIHLALVTGGVAGCKTTFGRADFNHILINFSPVAKNRDKMKTMPQDGEIDLLIATDCISEGQNLQDCDYLINYDIHWNPVRIIQRFGRIDRIGSINKAVQLVNFWPTQDLNKYINLKNRVEARMALVDIAATQEDNIL